MVNELLKQLFIFLLGGLLGVWLKYIFDYKAMVFKELWNKRHEVYKKFFTISSAFPLYPEPAKVTYDELYEISTALRDWYFNESGLSLSINSRKFYFKLQQSIQDILIQKKIIPKGNEENKAVVMTDTEYAIITKTMSDVRNEMTNDLRSRLRM